MSHGLMILGTSSTAVNVSFMIGYRSGVLIYVITIKLLRMCGMLNCGNLEKNMEN